MNISSRSQGHSMSWCKEAIDTYNRMMGSWTINRSNEKIKKIDLPDISTIKSIVRINASSCDRVHEVYGEDEDRSNNASWSL